MEKNLTLQHLVRQAGLGKLALKLFYQPLGRLQTCWKEGGPWQQARTEEGRRAMEIAASKLPPPHFTTDNPITLHLLTGQRFWYQTLFCLYSFSQQSKRPLAPVIYDDGTLSKTTFQEISRLFPMSRLVTQVETMDKLETYLPQSSFPFLRDRWQNYPNIRKLIDIHLGQSGWKLVLDSDLLFFGRPDLILSWIDNPTQPLHAIDVQESYGYSRQLMESLTGTSLSFRLNVGLCGLKSEELDWEKLEHWTRVLIQKEKTNYYLEQALVAMLLAGRSCVVAPEKEYVTLPRPPEATQCHAVMHHYVAESKRWYYQSNWNKAETPL